MPPFIRIRCPCRSTADQCSRDFRIPPEPMPAVCDSLLRHLAETKADSENSEHGSGPIRAATSSWRCSFTMTDWHLHGLVTASSGSRQAGVRASTCKTATKKTEWLFDSVPFSLGQVGNDECTQGPEREPDRLFRGTVLKSSSHANRQPVPAKSSARGAGTLLDE